MTRDISWKLAEPNDDGRAERDITSLQTALWYLRASLTSTFRPCIDMTPFDGRSDRIIMRHHACCWSADTHVLLQKWGFSLSFELVSRYNVTTRPSVRSGPQGITLHNLDLVRSPSDAPARGFS